MSSTSSRRATPRQPNNDGAEPAPASTILHAAGQLPATAPIEPATVISKQPPLLPQSGAPLGPIAMAVHELLGQSLEHFEIQQFIGGGGMGAVFQALDTRLNRTVALKVLSREQGADSETSRRFLNEAQSAARLDHPHIARVYYVGEDRGWHFIALEYIEGSNVRDLVDQSGPLPVADSVRYTLQLAEALAHASSRDVVHRDIKPSNVLITPSGVAKLVDMGLARLHQVEHSGGDLTASGVTLGTFDYISPEQARDPRSADPRSDIYSLGCTWYFMLAGQPPFPDGTVLQKLLQHQGDAPPDPQAARPDLPSEAAGILLKMMAKDPRDRFQSPNELVGALLILANQLGLQPTGASELVYVPAPMTSGSWLRQQLPWLAPVALLLGLVGAVQFSGQWQRLSERPLADATEQNPEDQSATDLRGPSNESAPTENRQADARPASTSSPDGMRRAPTGVDGDTTQTPSVATAPTAGTGEAPPLPPIPKPSARRPATAAVVGSSNDSGAKLQLDPESGALSAPRFSAELTAAEVARPPQPRRDDANSAARDASPNGDSASQRSATARDQREASQGLLVVEDNPAAGHFASLWAACAAARSGDIIELRFNGRREERPIVLANVDLTIRAGEEFLPQVVFSPRLTDPVGAPREMIRLAGGRLSLVNLRLELNLPRDGAPGENWTLLAIEAAGAVQVQGCGWTVVNEGPSRVPQHLNTSLIDVRPASGAMANADDRTRDVAPLEIRFEDSWGRGAADFVRVRDVGIDLQIDNAWLGLGQCLVAELGTSVEAPVRIELNHATVHALEGVVRMASTEPSAPRISVLATNCIFIGGEDSAVATGAGPAATTAGTALRWKSDRCFYEGFEVFTRSGGATPKESKWSDWRSFWGGGRDVWGRVGWRQPLDGRRAMHERIPAEYAVASDSAAFEAATDRRDIGMRLDELPNAPQPVDAQRSVAPAADRDAAAQEE